MPCHEKVASVFFGFSVSSFLMTKQANFLKNGYGKQGEKFSVFSRTVSMHKRKEARAPRGTKQPSGESNVADAIL
ncbi:MAG: hypothetical protein K6F46_03670, partial [Desulfovibrio sp.]|nr:hypothetical protein [Desulfovibrio sp.]